MVTVGKPMNLAPSSGKDRWTSEVLKLSFLNFRLKSQQREISSEAWDNTWLTAYNINLFPRAKTILNSASRDDPKEKSVLNVTLCPPRQRITLSPPQKCICNWIESDKEGESDTCDRIKSDKEGESEEGKPDKEGG